MFIITQILNTRTYNSGMSDKKNHLSDKSVSDADKFKESDEAQIYEYIDIKYVLLPLIFEAFGIIVSLIIYKIYN